MLDALWYLLAFVLIVYIAGWCRATLLGSGASEEAPHVAALLKRSRQRYTWIPAGRRGRRSTAGSIATARELGSGDIKAPCSIVKISHSGMRIALGVRLPADADVLVEWGDDFFVGTISHQARQSGEYSVGLRLISCSYARIPWQWRFAALRGIPARQALKWISKLEQAALAGAKKIIQAPRARTVRDPNGLRK